MNNTPDVIDFELAIELSAGDAEFAKDLIHTLLSTLPEHKRDLKQAYNSKDLDTLAKAAHKLSGAASYTGTVPLQTAAKSLENAAKAKDEPQTGMMYKNLLKEIERAASDIDEANLS